jgi:hypothetical protein
MGVLNQSRFAASSEMRIAGKYEISGAKHNQVFLHKDELVKPA